MFNILHSSFVHLFVPFYAKMLRDLYQYYKSTPWNFHNLPLKFISFLPTYSDHCLFLPDKLSPFIGEELRLFWMCDILFLFLFSKFWWSTVFFYVSKKQCAKEGINLYTAMCVVDLQEIVSFSTVWRVFKRSMKYV